MSNGEKNNATRWLETTSAALAADVTQAVAENNIPSSHEECNILLVREGTSRQATAAPATAVPATTTTEEDADAAATENLVAAIGSNSHFETAPFVKRLTASPNKIKTQIVKISYSPHHHETAASVPAHTTIKPLSTMIQRIHLENSSNQHSAPPSTSPCVDVNEVCIEEYAKKKYERDQEMLKIREMLEDMTIEPLASSKAGTKDSDRQICTTAGSTASKQQSPPPSTKDTNEIIPSAQWPREEVVRKAHSPTVMKTTFQRSKTDITSLSRKAATARARDPVRGPPIAPRSMSSRPFATKSSELLTWRDSPEKKVPYDREETRRFMEEQRRKRRALEAFNTQRSQTQSANDKERIKKRLEELNKQSRKIINKNIQNAQKRCGTAAKATAGGGRPSKAPKMEASALKHSQDGKEVLDKMKPNANVVAAAKNPEAGECQSSRNEKKQKAKDATRGNLWPGALTENQKRIGILRKPETKDHSYSAIKGFDFDKENVALEMLTPRYTVHTKCKLVAPSTTPTSTPREHETEGVVAAEQEEKSNEIERKQEQKNKIEEENKQQEPHNLRQNKEKSSKQSSVKIEEQLQKQVFETLEEQRQSKAITTSREETFRSNSIFKLDTPPTYLRVRSSVHEQAIQVSESLSAMAKGNGVKKSFNERAELPYWLKPSNVHIYPFNFIMAVRRKLEAFANTPQKLSAARVTEIRNKTTCTIEDCRTKKSEKTSLSSVIKERFNAGTQQHHSKHHLMSNVNEEDDSDDQEANRIHSIEGRGFEKSFKKVSVGLAVKSTGKIIEKPSDNLKEISKLHLENVALSKSQTLTDMTSNFSSISINLPASNTADSEDASVKSNSKMKLSSSPLKPPQKGDDDTTISSSILNSPEKQNYKSERNDSNEVFKVPRRPVSPLSLERIEHLKISPKKNNKHDTRKRRSHSKSADSSVSEVDINQLLHDFNRNLSQVIEVNEQLKVTIDNSHHFFSHERQAETNITEHNTEVEYSTDFESAGSSNAKAISTEGNTKNINTNNSKMCKRNLFEVNSVKPLQNYSESGAENGNPSLDCNLNLNSLEISVSSNMQTTESSLLRSAKARTFIRPDSHCSSGNSLDERLKRIEQLKNDLKQNILKSQANRHEVAQIEAEQRSCKKKLFDSCENRKKDIKDESRCTFSKISTEEFDRIDHTNESNKTRSLQSVSHSLSIDSDNVPAKCHSSLQPRIKMSIDPSEDEPPIVSAQLGASAHTADASKAHSVSSHSPRTKVSAADLTYTCDSKANAPDTKIFITEKHRHTASHSSTTGTEKSSDLYDKSIAEELQNPVEMPSTHSNNAAGFQDESAQNRSRQASDLDKQSSPTKSQLDSAAFIRSHINRSRGDFVVNENHKISLASCENRFKSVAASSSTESSGDTESSAGPPPSYVAVTERSKLKHSPLTAHHSKRLSTQPLVALKSPKQRAVGREYVRVYNQSDLELSIISSHNGSVSETSLNYSSVGLYEQLIQTETTKSEHLSALLKMREKALIDRTKGQIAWLEVQKERYKSRGLLMQIAAIKKKQRGILLKMEKEREDIKRLLQSTSSTSANSANRPSNNSTNVQQQPLTPSKRQRSELRKTTPPSVLPPPPLLTKTNRSSSRSAHHQQQKRYQHTTAITSTTVHSNPVVRANYDLESNRILEELLQRREADLRARRQHVERLMQWHQRLDQEEAEVQQLERMLLSCNNAHAQERDEHQPYTSVSPPQQKTADSRRDLSLEQQPRATTQTISSPHKRHTKSATATSEIKMERRIKEIERSLRELCSISASRNSVTSADDGSRRPDATEYVRTSGSKLNKLWRRLTAQQVERFDPTRRYKLCKADLERLYEEAKVVVLHDFPQEERIQVDLLDKTTTPTLDQSQSSTSQSHSAGSANITLKIPRLKLNFSPENSQHSDEDLADEEERVMDLSKEQQEEQSTAMRHEAEELITPPVGGTYSPSAAAVDYIKQESTSPSSRSSSSSSQNGDEHALELESVEQRREAVLERNVQKFMELTQRFSSSVHGSDGLQRSLSDTQIAENGTGVPKKSGKNSSAYYQRNIAYYGVKTQNRPSMVVNVEIANSLSSASSILTAASLRKPRSAPISSTVAQVASPPEGTSLNKNNNNIPSSTPLSPFKESRRTTASTDSNSRDITSMSCISTTNLHIQAINSEAETQIATSNISEDSLPISLMPSANTSSNQQPQSEQGRKLHPFSTAANENVEPFSADTCPSYSSTFEEDETVPSTAASPSSEPKQQHAVHSSSTSNTLLLRGQNVTAAQQSPSTLPSPNPPLHFKATAATDLLTETMVLEKYNAEFENTVDDDYDEMRLEDLSLPHFESTIETTQNDDEDPDNETSLFKATETASTASVPRLQRDDFSKTSNSNDASLRVSENLPPPSMPPPPPVPLPSPQVPSTSKEDAAVAAANGVKANSTPPQQPQLQHQQQQQLMPDIINELEPRRNQQPTQQYEHVTVVPYNMYVREIPNKPPPPYVPPAHGSPMTTIFPAEERIKDLTYRRTHELYCELLKTEYTNEKGEKLPSVLEEKITNIYERIILDICREYLEEHKDVLTKMDPDNFHSQLAFFNPPDRLSCLQNFVYQEVRRCLAMDKKQPKRTQVYSVYGQRAQRDYIGQIIIQEMYDEDGRWCNFHREENEVLDLITEEMIKNIIGDTVKEVLVEEGGTLDEETGAEALAEEANVQRKASAESQAHPNETHTSSTSVIQSLSESSASAAAVTHDAATEPNNIATESLTLTAAI